MSTSLVMEQRTFCPECEIRRLMVADTPQKIAEVISSMPFIEGVTAPPAVYSKRLAVCRTCPSFKAEMMCAECGTYVAYRARQLDSTCPYPGSDKWNS